MLKGIQFKQLREALLSAYPKIGALRSMVREGMEENLESIAGGADLSEIVFSLIQWAETNNRLEELVEKAYYQVPHNPQLRLVAEQIFGLFIPPVRPQLKKQQCYLSYAAADREIALALAEFLVQNDENVYLPLKLMKKDDLLDTADTLNALHKCSKFIYLTSIHYINSKFCQIEWANFLDRYRDSNENLSIVGISLDKTEPPHPLKSWLSFSLQSNESTLGQNKQWMKDVLSRVRQFHPDSTQEVSGSEIETIAEKFANRVMTGPINVDLLQQPLIHQGITNAVREGVLFLKPEGTYNPTCIRKVVERLLHEQINVVQARKYTGRHVKDHQLFEKHYYRAVNIARHIPPEFNDQEISKLQRLYLDRWQEFYGEKPSLDVVIPALRLLETPYNLTSREVSELWDRGREPDLFWNEKPNGLNKIGYQKSVFPVTDPRIDNGRTRLILNGYVPKYKELLELPADDVRVVILRLSTNRDDWDRIRDEVFGGDSNPEKCQPQTLRHQASDNQADFGIHSRYVINGQSNLLHASATPLEGIYEISLWFDVPLDDTWLGVYLANRLGGAHLKRLFLDIHEFLNANAARGKAIEDLVFEPVETVATQPKPEVVPEFDEFKRKTLERFVRDFPEHFDSATPNLLDELSRTPAIHHIIEIGYQVQKSGYKSIVDKFLPNFDNPFFREKCRQFSSLVVFMDREQLMNEPELIGLAIKVVCSDLLILSHSSYPPNFVADFLGDLHQRAKDIALRTRKNALQQCPVALQVVHEGQALNTLPIFKDMHNTTVNVGGGDPDLIVLLLAGGRSTRVQSIIPKPVLKLGNQYLIEHMIKTIEHAFGPKATIIMGLGWEYGLLRACLGSRYRDILLSNEDAGRQQHLGLGPGARLYAALRQLEKFEGSILVCYSDMPKIQPESLKKMKNHFVENHYHLCFLTADDAPLPQHLERDDEGNVVYVSAERPRQVASAAEPEIGFYMFHNTKQIRTALGEVTNENIKKEYGIQPMVETLAKQGVRIGSVQVSAEECMTVNNASDLFCLALGLDRASLEEELGENEIIKCFHEYKSFKKDYGATFTLGQFIDHRNEMIKHFYARSPNRAGRLDLPLHFLVETLLKRHL